MQQSAATTFTARVSGLRKVAPKYLLHWLASTVSTTLRSPWEVHKWLKAGGLGPPPHIVKQFTVREYGLRFGLDTLIETGTYLGEMVNTMRCVFSCVYSIEVQAELYRKAARRFRRDSRVTILYGDSATCLPQLLNSICTPCLFWLDGHYSGGITDRGEVQTPIVSEIAAILQHRVQTNSE